MSFDRWAVDLGLIGITALICILSTTYNMDCQPHRQRFTVLTQSRKVQAMEDLQEAALWGRLPIVRKALSETADASNLDLDIAAMKLLQFWGLKSSEKARLECLRLLLQAGADPSAVDVAPGPGEGRSLLAYAVRSRNVDAVKALIAAGADLSRRDKFGFTILDDASAGGEPAIREALEQAGGRRSIYPTVSRAAYHGDVQRVRELLEAGADPLADSALGNPLSLAAGNGHVAVCRILLEAGLDVEGSENDFTPLMSAAAKGHVDVARLLIRNGADVQAKRRGNTPLKMLRGAVNLTKVRKQEFMALLANEGVKMDPAFALMKEFAKAAQQPAFLEALRHVGGLLGSDPRPWNKRKGVYQFWGANGTALAQAQADARAAGFCLIGNETWRPKPTALLFPTRDKYAVIAACGTNTNMGGHDAHDLIVWLRDMERDNPFELTECGFDQLAGVFSGPVVDALPLAERMMRLCPELTGPAEALADELRQSREFGFWWD